MIEQDLYQQGQQTAAQGQYLTSLAHFLHLRDRGIDLIDTLHIDSGADKLDLDDIDQNTVKDLAVLSRGGQWYIWLQGGGKDHIQIRLNHDVYHSFCLQGTPLAGPPLVLVAKKCELRSELVVYRKTMQGDRVELRRDRDLASPLEGQVLDMVSIRRKMYITTSARRIYQLNSINFQLEDQIEVETIVKRIFPGRLVYKGEALGAADQQLLGISSERGIALFASHADGLAKAKTFGEDTQFISVCSADTDNDGEEDIVACTHSGKVVIYDRNSASKKYEYGLADELYDIACSDIDGDGKIEILVGAKSNRVYVLAVDAERAELMVKGGGFPMTHRVWRLWVGDIDADGEDRRLIVGLADGTVQIFRLYTQLAVSHQIRETILHFKKNDSTWAEKLLMADKPELVRFGLDQIAREMSCEKIIAFLNAERDQAVYLAILPKLGTFVARYPDEQALLSSVKHFIDRLFLQCKDLPTCDKIWRTLDEIVQQPGRPSEELLELSRKFFRESWRRSNIPIKRLERIRELIFKQTLAEASEETDTLALLGVDLLQSSTIREGIRAIACSTRDSQIVLTTNADSLRIFNADLNEILEPLRFSVSKIFYFPVSHGFYSHVVVYGNQVTLYDEHFKPLKHASSYSDPVRCVQVIEHPQGPYWVVGFEDGRVVLDSLSGVQKTFKASMMPLRIAQHSRGEAVDIYFITLNCDVFMWQDIAGLMTGTVPYHEPQLITRLEPSVNVLDLSIIDTETTNVEILVLAPDAIHKIELDQQSLRTKRIPISKPLTCIAACHKGYLPYHMLVGTQERSLLFIGNNDEILRETYLADIPTSLCVARKVKESIEVLVGFAQGDLHRYRCVGPDEIGRIRTQCDRNEEFERTWSRYALAEKLALMGIVNEKWPSLQTICNCIDQRFLLLVPVDAINRGVWALEGAKVICSEMRADTVCYELTDKDFADWIRLQKNPFEDVRLQRNELSSNLQLRDLKHIESVSKKLFKKVRYELNDESLGESSQYKSWTRSSKSGVHSLC